MVSNRIFTVFYTPARNKFFYPTLTLMIDSYNFIQVNKIVFVNTGKNPEYLNYFYPLFSAHTDDRFLSFPVFIP